MAKKVVPISTLSFNEILNADLQTIKTIATSEYRITVEDVRILITKISTVFTRLCVHKGYDSRQVLRVTTKLRDAGRRSPPWKPASSKVPGRPQDGSDGNRIKRWLLDKNHKFYADEITATLTEVKYYLQLLSMEDAPQIPTDSIQKSFGWMLEHEVKPGYYLDPIQLVSISLNDVINDASTVQSGHLHPLDRGGKHEPSNAFLMLARSNQLQGNLTVEELLELLAEILRRHEEHKKH